MPRLQNEYVPRWDIQCDSTGAELLGYLHHTESAENALSNSLCFQVDSCRSAGVSYS